jgi:hypothetical protein
MLKELKQQATLNKQEYEAFIKTEQNAKDVRILKLDKEALACAVKKGGILWLK